MAKYKSRALQRVRNYLSTEKASLLAKAFINSQFYYATLICMFAGKTQYQKYKKLPLAHCKWFTIHMRNLIMDCLS